jgi:hypothetical protein
MIILSVCHKHEFDVLIDKLKFIQLLLNACDFVNILAPQLLALNNPHLDDLNKLAYC